MGFNYLGKVNNRFYTYRKQQIDILKEMLLVSQYFFLVILIQSIAAEGVHDLILWASSCFVKFLAPEVSWK